MIKISVQKNETFCWKQKFFPSKSAESEIHSIMHHDKETMKKKRNNLNEKHSFFFHLIRIYISEIINGVNTKRLNSLPGVTFSNALLYTRQT